MVLTVGAEPLTQPLGSRRRDAGNGDQFAVSQRANREVYVWDHENDSRSWVAPSVMRYLEWWMTGVIAV